MGKNINSANIIHSKYRHESEPYTVHIIRKLYKIFDREKYLISKFYLLFSPILLID